MTRLFVLTNLSTTLVYTSRMSVTEAGRKIRIQNTQSDEQLAYMLCCDLLCNMWLAQLLLQAVTSTHMMAQLRYACQLIPMHWKDHAQHVRWFPSHWPPFDSINLAKGTVETKEWRSLQTTKNSGVLSNHQLQLGRL